MSIIFWALTGCGPKQEPVTPDEQELNPQRIDTALARQGKVRQEQRKEFPNINQKTLTDRIISSGHDDTYAYEGMNLTGQAEGNNYTVTRIGMTDYQYQRFAKTFHVDIDVYDNDPLIPNYPTGGGDPDSGWDGSTVPAVPKGSGNPDEKWDDLPKTPQRDVPTQPSKGSGSPGDEDEWGGLWDMLNPVSTAHAQTIVDVDAGWRTLEDTNTLRSSLSVDFMVSDAAHTNPTRCTLTLNRVNRALYDQNTDWTFIKGVDTLTCNDQWAVNDHKLNADGKVIKLAGRIHAAGVSAAIQGRSGF